MTCYHPIKAYWSNKLTVNGKRTLLFSSKGSNGSITEIPCGQCIGCRLERSRQWAIRISNEASIYDKNCFITLTYSPENLPSDGSLHVAHYQLFMKRLRKKYGSNIRFFHCGEYGEKQGRPHYHACLLNFDFPDKYHYCNSPRGDPLYRSSELEKLWPYGLCQIGSVTFESAAYVARYITKKITGPMADYHYQGRKPEYTTMSRRPGIGVPFLKKFHSDIYPHDRVVIRGGVQVNPPRFYNQQYEVMYPEKYQKIKSKRLSKSLVDISRKLRDNTEERLNVKEIVTTATINATLNRKIEKE